MYLSVTYAYFYSVIIIALIDSEVLTSRPFKDFPIVNISPSND